MNYHLQAQAGLTTRKRKEPEPRPADKASFSDKLTRVLSRFAQPALEPCSGWPDLNSDTPSDSPTTHVAITTHGHLKEKAAGYHHVIVFSADEDRNLYAPAFLTSSQSGYCLHKNRANMARSVTLIADPAPSIAASQHLGGFIESPSFEQCARAIAVSLQQLIAVTQFALECASLSPRRNFTRELR